VSWPCPCWPRWRGGNGAGSGRARGILVSGLAGRGPAPGHPLAGIGYGLSSSVAYAGFLLIFRQSAGRTAPSGPARVAGPLADATAGAAVAALVLGAAFGGLSFTIGWAALGWLLLLSFSSQTVGWLLITSSLPRLPAAVSSLLLLLQPAGPAAAAEPVSP
jgi:drug/metabolite transporter (DMT)-like permease